MSCSVKKWEALTPDVTTSTTPWQALYVGSGGDVEIVDPSGATFTLPNMATGGVYYFEFLQIVAANTTASDLFGGRI